MLRPLASITTRFFLWWNKARSPKTAFDISAIKSIVCIETSRMGDVVSAIPFFYSLHNANPDASIIIVTDEHFTDIIHCLPFVSKAIGVENTSTGMGFIGARSLLQGINADLAVSVSPSYRNALLTLGTTAKYKIGYFTSPTPTTPFLNKTEIESVGFKMKKSETYWMEHIQQRSLKIVKGLGMVVANEWKLSVDESRGDEVLERLGVGHSRYVVMHPFSGWSYRNWNFNNYLSLAEQLGKQNIHTIIIGGESESKQIDMNLFEGKRYIHTLFHEKLAAVIGVMKRSSLFIGNDSGPLHLASAAGVPCVGLFGPASPALTAPISESNVYLYEQVECSPCEQIRCIRPENPCMQLISTDRVTESVLKLLNRSTAGGY